ncbi:MAG: hypothetical protein ACI8XO_004535, partial [Verrucomicrobiales bacterium]
GLCRCFRLLATSSSPLGSLFRFASALPASQGFGWRQGICFWRGALEGDIAGAKERVKLASELWPPIRLEMLDDPAL